MTKGFALNHDKKKSNLHQLSKAARKGRFEIQCMSKAETDYQTSKISLDERQRFSLEYMCGRTG